MALLRLQVEQGQGRRGFFLGADLGAHVEDFDISVVADEVRHLVRATFVAIFGVEGHQQGIAERGELLVDHLKTVAEEEGQRRLGVVDLLALATAAIRLFFALLTFAHRA